MSRIQLSLGLAFAAAAICAAFSAGLVYAADQRLYDADAALEKAIALVKAAENPGVVPPFQNHDKKAVKFIEKAREEIALAIAYADGAK